MDDINSEIQARMQKNAEESLRREQEAANKARKEEFIRRLASRRGVALPESRSQIDLDSRRLIAGFVLSSIVNNVPVERKNRPFLAYGRTPLSEQLMGKPKVSGWCLSIGYTRDSEGYTGHSTVLVDKGYILYTPTLGATYEVSVIGAETIRSSVVDSLAKANVGWVEPPRQLYE